jgi:hypothetical protein
MDARTGQAARLLWLSYLWAIMMDTAAAYPIIPMSLLKAIGRLCAVGHV